jgi:hypothetical protein
MPDLHGFFLSHVDEVLLKSDNAGCYHCSSLISFLFHMNTTSTVKVLENNFSEPQAGKDMCDANTAHCKMHILRLVNTKCDDTCTCILTYMYLSLI